ncbi:MAG: DUF6788 family protein [Pseudomonadota bacterium]
MQSEQAKTKERYRLLVEELKGIGGFRRGSVNVFYRKCGKKGCVCNQEGHPGHGPQTTLTFKHQGKTSARNLPSAAAVRLVKKQIENHDRFQEWCRKWVELNEERSDLELDEVLSESQGDEEQHQKKLRRRSKKRFSGRSTG